MPGPVDPASGDRLECELEDGVLTLRIANEERANALTERVLDAIVRAIDESRPPEVRVVLIGGAGERHFSSGADLAVRGIDEWLERVKRTEAALSRAAGAVANCHCPVIAVLNGDAIGGALELAMACDWRVAREGARFAMPPARLGLVYTAEGMRRFVAAIGQAHARELFLTGRAVDAARAERIGLVGHVVPAEEIWPLAGRMAAAVAANAPIAVEGMRAVLRAIADDENADARAQQWRVKAFGSADLVEGLAATRERRPPEFTGA